MESSNKPVSDCCGAEIKLHGVHLTDWKLTDGSVIPNGIYDQWAMCCSKCGKQFSPSLPDIKNDAPYSKAVQKAHEIIRAEAIDDCIALIEKEWKRAGEHEAPYLPSLVEKLESLNPQ